MKTKDEIKALVVRIATLGETYCDEVKEEDVTGATKLMIMVGAAAALDWVMDGDAKPSIEGLVTELEEMRKVREMLKNKQVNPKDVIEAILKAAERNSSWN